MLDMKQLKKIRHPIPDHVAEIKYKSKLYLGKKPKGEVVFKKGRGRDRIGIRCKSLSEAVDGSMNRLQVEKPRFMIDIVSCDNAQLLTAKDHALYELLLAHARKEGMTKVWHEISLGLIKSFVGVSSIDRLDEALQRILVVKVKYDTNDEPRHFRKLLNEVFLIKKETGKFIRFSIPEATRDDVLDSKDYTWVDLKVFRSFKNKYSARLYQKLSLIAGYNCKFRGPWIVSMQQLAEFVGYAKKDEAFHNGTFDRAIRKAIKELQDSDLEFSFSFARPKRSKMGKGRPLDGYTFVMSKKERSELYAQKAAHLSGIELNRIYDRKYCDLKKYEFPKRLWIAQAVSYLNDDACTISDKWREDITAAHKNAYAIIGKMKGADLLDSIENNGLKLTFEKWVKSGFVSKKAGKKIRARDLLREDYDLHLPFEPILVKEPAEEFENHPSREFVDQLYANIIDEKTTEIDEMEAIYLDKLVDEYAAKNKSFNEVELSVCDDDIPF